MAAAHRHYGVTIRETVELDKHPAAFWNHSGSCLSSGEGQKRWRWYSIWPLLRFQWSAEPDLSSRLVNRLPKRHSVVPLYPNKCRKTLQKSSHITGLFNPMVFPEKLNRSLYWRESYLMKDTDDLCRAAESSKWYGPRINTGSASLTEYKAQVEPPIMWRQCSKHSSQRS